MCLPRSNPNKRSMTTFGAGKIMLIVFMLICIQPIRAAEPRCNYLDMEMRLMDKFTLLESQNKEILSRLTTIETQVTNKKENKRTDIPPFSNILRINDLEYDNWTMVFRATAGNGFNVYDAWTEGKGACDSKPETMERSQSCHYRSKLVTAWSNIHIDRVKFALYSQDRELAYVIFNGRGSDLSTWFDKSRIIFSSWSDLTSSHTFNYFSIAGRFTVDKLSRRFYISRLHAGCDKDQGHVAIIDTMTVPGKTCKWDDHVVYPQFLYSQINSVDIWNDNHYGRAEYMAIFIKTQ